MYDVDVKLDQPQQPTIQKTTMRQEMDGEQEPHLLEPHDGEMSMDLATPLMPTSVLSAHRLSFTEPYHPPPPSSAEYAEHHDRLDDRFHHNDQAAFDDEDIEHEHDPLWHQSSHVITQA